MTEHDTAAGDEGPVSHRFAAERAALRDLLLCLALPPLLYLALGWRPGTLLGGNDLLLLCLPLYQRLLDVGGDFAAFLYDPAWLGGAKLRDVFGALPLWGALARLRVAPITALNLTVLLNQVLYAFLGLRLCLSLAALLARREGAAAPVVPTLTRAVLVVLLAAAPVLAWRLAYGHVIITLAALPPVVGGALVLARAAGEESRTTTLIGFLALWHALPQVAAQSLINGAVFCAPLALALLLCLVPRGARWRSLAALAGPLCAALLLSLAALWGIAQHHQSSDSPRAMTQAVFTYSYLIATPADWLASLPWSLSRGLAGLRARPEDQWHETNYPVGPLLPLALLLWPRTRRRVLLALGLSAALIVGFSADVKPFSDVLLWLLAPLRLFRVPARAALPFLLLATPVLLAPLLLLPLRVRRADLLLMALARVLMACEGLVREALLWVGALVFVVPALRGATLRFSATAGLGLLAVGAVLAQGERLLPFVVNEAAVLALPRRAGAVARAAQPGLASPLSRVLLGEVDDARVGLNGPYLGGLAALDGYGVPPERFLRLQSALRDEPYNATQTVLRFQPGAPGDRTLRLLYHVIATLQVQQGQISVDTVDRVDDDAPRGATSGSAAAWFSQQVSVAPDWAGLARALRGDGRDGPDGAALRATLRLLRGDPRGIPLQDGALAGCAAARVAVEDTGRGPLLLRAVVHNPGPASCPLTVASNYAELLRAFGDAPGQAARPLRTFPAYGALLGVLVPPGVTRVTIEAREAPPWWARHGAWLGLLVLLLHLGPLGRRRS